MWGVIDLSFICTINAKFSFRLSRCPQFTAPGWWWRASWKAALWIKMDASTSETSSCLWVPPKAQQMAFFYCALWRQIPCCLKYILCWILTISASRNLHSVQLLVAPYAPIRVFFSWWRGILLVLLLLPSISSSSLVFTYAFYLPLFLFLITIDFFSIYLHLPHLRTIHSIHKKFPSVSIVPVLSPWRFSLLLTFPSLVPPPSGGRGEPAGLQWAACHGGAEEDRPPGQTEAAEEGRPSESHPASSSSPAAPPTLPQLPRGQPLQSGPQQDSRVRCFVLREGNILAQWYHKGIVFLNNWANWRIIIIMQAITQIYVLISN